MEDVFGFERGIAFTGVEELVLKMPPWIDERFGSPRADLSGASISTRVPMPATCSLFIICVGFDARGNMFSTSMGPPPKTPPSMLLWVIE